MNIDKFKELATKYGSGATVTFLHRGITQKGVLYKDNTGHRFWYIFQNVFNGRSPDCPVENPFLYSWGIYNEDDIEEFNNLQFHKKGVKIKEPTLKGKSSKDITNVSIPQSVNLIGIEFEGLFDDNSPIWYLLEKIGLWEQDGDSSVENQGEGNEYNPKECRTKPMNEKELNKILRIMRYAEKKGLYKLNESVGLHFHVSVTENNYGSICTKEFYNDMENMFRVHFPRVYESRKHGPYARVDEIRPDHFERTSYARYRMVNYCYTEHKTFEVRLYGGEFATIKGLANCINRTLAIVEMHAKKHKELKSEIEVDSHENKKDFSVSLEMPPKTCAFFEKNIPKVKSKRWFRPKTIQKKIPIAPLEITIKSDHHNASYNFPIYI